MTSQKKIEANRRNAALSTGPKSAAGKRIVSKNAMRHGLLSNDGLLADENPAEFAAFCIPWEIELDPEGPIEESMARNIISLAWRLERARRMDAGLHTWNSLVGQCHGIERKDRPSVKHYHWTLREAVKAEHSNQIKTAEPDHRRAMIQAVKDLADRKMARALSAFAWTNPGTEQIERYEAKIERRLRKQIREFEARQAARIRASISREKRTAVLPQAA